MYIKAADQATMDSILGSQSKEIEHVYLGKVITNYPETGPGWIPEYSYEIYITVAPGQDINVPPENQVGLINAKYGWKWINHYFGEPMP